MAEPDKLIEQLDILALTNGRQLSKAGKRTQVDRPDKSCIHELFEAQVAQSPDAIAVTFDGQQLTYSELNARANQLANHLRQLNVGPDVLVGLCIERSLELIVGVL